MPPLPATSPVTTADFERRRQLRETANEQVVSGIVVGVLTILLGTELLWSDLAAVRIGNFKGQFEIPVQVRWATAGKGLVRIGRREHATPEPLITRAMLAAVPLAGLVLQGG